MTAGVSQLKAASFVIHASMYAEECPPGIGLDSIGGKVQEMAKKGKIDIMVSLQSGTFTTPLSYIFFLAAFFLQSTNHDNLRSDIFWGARKIERQSILA